MVHIDNLCRIFQHGALFSKELLKQKGIIVPRSIAYETVQNLRDRIFIRDFSEQKYRNLHSYVPFYFVAHSPMLHVQHKAGIQDQIVFLEVSRFVLQEAGVLFTDGNATNQRLSKDGSEKVGIVPAIRDAPCRRTYRPTGPHGTNENLSNFYGTVALLDQLNWYRINGGRIESWDEDKRVRSAEVLVPDSLPTSRIECIAVRTEEIVQQVRALLLACKIPPYVTPIISKPHLFVS
jgi:hypothetical protein